jgi:hypothetical protein
MKEEEKFLAGMLIRASKSDELVFLMVRSREEKKLNIWRYEIWMFLQ